MSLPRHFLGKAKASDDPDGDVLFPELNNNFRESARSPYILEMPFPVLLSLSFSYACTNYLHSIGYRYYDDYASGFNCRRCPPYINVAETADMLGNSETVED
jgi:hypothetical protein